MRKVGNSSDAAPVILDIRDDPPVCSTPAPTLAPENVQVATTPGQTIDGVSIIIVYLFFVLIHIYGNIYI